MLEPRGKSWKLPDTYVGIEESPAGTGPHERTAGGPDHYAPYMENCDGFGVELVADEPSPR